ncbi:MAG: nucleotide sugar dehydrogenase [Planctomycetes bacterium]|nr:nucleotide sugar dehydrogenase [Planctomycetota bacterium]
MHEPSLIQRFASRDARVAVLGLGTVGLPLARAFCDAGFRVLGYDTDAERVARLARGENPLTYLNHGVLEAMLTGGRFEATGDPERLREADALVLCVPTPLDAARQPDLSHVEAAAETVARALRPGQLVVLESTTWPGTTREVVLPRLAARGLALGTDYFLAYAPEREDPGREGVTTRQIPRLVGGLDAASTRVALALYAAALDDVRAVSSVEVAEAAKLFENTFRAVNIALVNELKLVLDRLGVDVWEVVEAAATKPFGFMKFTPGPGMGGHCIPVDPFYLAWAARRAGVDTRFVELAGEINRRMPEYVVERALAALAERGVTPPHARVLVMGLAYKANVDSLHEAPAIRMLELLHAAGARCRYADPWVPRAPEACEPWLEEPEALALDVETLAGFDAVVLATDHAAFDYALVAEHARLVVDTRNAFAHLLAGDSRYVRA